MVHLRQCIVAAVVVLQLGMGASQGMAQQEIGFLEKFALAEDRREALRELIPGTHEYFYFHCLHYQNEKQLAESEAILQQWRAKFGETGQLQNMHARQALLTYAENRRRTLEYLEKQLGLQLHHAPPSKDRAAQLKTVVDNALLSTDAMLARAIAADRNFGQVENDGLHLIIDRKMAPNQLRSVLGRLNRADLDGLVARIAEELSLKDSKGFGWANVHQLLSQKQLDELLRLQPNLLENDRFVRAYTVRLAPAEGTLLIDKVALREYLERLVAWTRRLPPSQNSLKALVLGNLLKLDQSEQKFDRGLFLEYLALPRSAPYYDLRRFRNQRVAMTELNFKMSPQIPLPAIGNDNDLVKSYLEHFLKQDERLDPYAKFLKRDYLERVLAETKILYGQGDKSTWYAKLSPADQKNLRERIEVRFLAHNANRFDSGDDVQLHVEIKNVAKLTIKIYEINTAAYYRNHDKAIGTDVDLDGLVANAQRELDFSQPADQRHVETLSFPEMEGRGIWIVDLLGAGQRSRALIQKGDIVAVERLGDAGHVYQVFDEQGNPLETAHIELGGRSFQAEEGRIIVPYAETTTSRNLIVVDGDFAARKQFRHLSEQYELQAGFFIDRQALVAGKKASIAINPRLYCNGRPISISLLEDSQLKVTATDLDGISTTQSLGNLSLEDGDEHLHTFLVPPRLTTIEFSLAGKIFNQNRAVRQDVAASKSITCNGIARTGQIGDFFLQKLPDGYRVLALGRNGEPIARLPVSIRFKHRFFGQPHSVNVATNGNGVVELGALDQIEQITVHGQGIQAQSFSPSDGTRNWPGVLHVAEDETIRLPLGRAADDVAEFSLYEIRRGAQTNDVRQQVSLANGGLTIDGLPAGDYRLLDHRFGQVVNVKVCAGKQSSSYVIGAHRALQTRRNPTLIIEDVVVDEDGLRINLAGADPMTRVHLIANAFHPIDNAMRQIEVPSAPLMSRRYSPALSHYINSLRLDEEYSYILDRQGQPKYPGNMLTTPSVLIHPWEVSVTENKTQEAADGDAVPPSAAAMDAQQQANGARKQAQQGSKPDWKSYDFLGRSAVLLGNLGVENGQVKIPLEALGGLTSVTVVAVHPESIDSRQLNVDGELVTRDLRLKSSFAADTHLSQVQRVEFLTAGEAKNMGNAGTRRFQTYATIADVFQLYSTILKNGEWEKFRFLTRWPTLSKEEKQAKYSELACHEFNFFLYFKDRPFFDETVAPLIRQKLDKQLVDQWLLSGSLEGYETLWRFQRTNTLERILLASRSSSDRTRTWLNHYLTANPIGISDRQRRFEVALRGRDLSMGSGIYAGAELMMMGELEAAPSDKLYALGGGGMGGAARGMESRFDTRSARQLRRGRAKGESQNAAALGLADGVDAFYFGVERLGRGGEGEFGFFQSLDQTREWAESQYYRVRITEQTAELIAPNPFWSQFLDAECQPFLPTELELPCGSLNEALCALAVIDLPFESEQIELEVKDEQLWMTSDSPAVVFLQSIEPTEWQGNNSLLVGQDLFLADPHTNQELNRPLGDSALLRGVPYRADVVVTNPSNAKQRVQVLTQLPTGAIALSSSQATRSTPLELAPYSTARVQYSFYFPAEGNFDHYGAQIAVEERTVANADSSSWRVLAEPESVDESTWQYVADWGEPQQVIDYLQNHNVQQLDLSRIAFRMSDASFYREVTELLSGAGRFAPELWAYAVKHDDVDGMEQLLQNRRDFTSRLGASFSSTLVSIDPSEQASYEHLDYRPMVVARIHQLGQKRTVLNPSLFAQYNRLLDVLAHQDAITNDQKLQACYYMLLQNRISEALGWFAKVTPDALETRIQYDYFDAYLDFYRGDYDRANQIAAKYAAHPVPRWKEMFGQVQQQVSEREALLSGNTPSTLVSRDRELGPSQKLLLGDREQQQAAQAEATPSLTLEKVDGEVLVHHQNLDEVTIDYYLMDIELLFSRRPFVGQGRDRSPVIQPNRSQTLKLTGDKGSQALLIPAEMRNKNILIEVTAKGIAKSTVLTANALKVTVVEPYGLLRVLSRQDGSPVEGAYVKVYAKHRDGTEKFFKDGYTDLRGQFDYATLSTGDLDTTARLSILVLDERLGASVQEVGPPTR